MKLEIISGGQTGVDRAALDTAIRYDLPCGGWCPPGRLAEDGPLSNHYPLTELSSGGYPARTRRNVKDADGTLIIHGGVVGRGTGLTINTCKQLNKPMLILKLDNCDANSDFSKQQDSIKEFLQGQQIEILNVAGPRASGWLDGYALCRKILAPVFVSYN
ncbi:MAG: putative molybdenum carrier protein [Xanthomonadales bacterium]|nr:putative molybdenum carrier protein [Xanthomonadales bacterium]